MGMFTKISESAFKEFQLNAGVLLNNFDPTNPAEPADEDIVCATTGGIAIDCKPKYSDMGEDVDNCPNNTMELKNHEGYDCKIGFTCLDVSLEAIRLALGAADVDATTSKVTPRRNLKESDFADKWWVGDRVDGGLVAVCLKNALSTGGLSLKTTKNGKGQISVELTGHVSIKDPNTMPMDFYSTGPAAEAAAASVSETDETEKTEENTEE